MNKKILLSIFIFVFIFAFSLPASAEDYNVYIKNGSIVDEVIFNQEDDFKKIVPIDNAFNKFIDYSNGYTLEYPNSMWVDVSLSNIKNVFANHDTQIEVYYDDFKNTVHSYNDYTVYSNKFLNNTSDHDLESKKTIYINNHKTTLLKWKRKKLSKVYNDKNYYISAEIKKNNNEVYTILIKSNSEIQNYMHIIKSLNFIKKTATPKITKSFTKPNQTFNEETLEFYNKYFLNSTELNWGIFEPSAPTTFDYLHKLENKLDYNFNFVVRYQTFDTNLPLEELINSYNENRYVELTLQTMNYGKDNSSITYDILDGKYDDYLTKYAKDIKEFNHPILFRLNNEMNGDWCVYSSYYSSKDTELYKALWRYIYSVFKENNVNNVLWVWNPHDLSFPNFAWNNYLNYYPGDEYVDIIGLTGYNTGSYYKGEIWRDFDEIYPPLYQEYSNLFDFPFMITEFGSNSVGGNKIDWIKDMFSKINIFKNIKVAIWWSGIDWDVNKNPARIYRLDENEMTIETFKEGLSK